MSAKLTFYYGYEYWRILELFILVSFLTGKYLYFFSCRFLVIKFYYVKQVRIADQFSLFTGILFFHKNVDPKLRKTFKLITKKVAINATFE